VAKDAVDEISIGRYPCRISVVQPIWICSSSVAFLIGTFPLEIEIDSVSSVNARCVDTPFDLAVVAYLRFLSYRSHQMIVGRTVDIRDQIRVAGFIFLF